MRLKTVILFNPCSLWHNQRQKGNENKTYEAEVEIMS